MFVLGGESGRLFKPLAFTKTFSMAAASLLSVTIIPVLMVYFITARVLPKRWGWQRNLLITLAAMLLARGRSLLPSTPVRALARTAGGWPSAGPCSRGCCWFRRGSSTRTATPISRMLQWLYEPVLPRGDPLPLGGADPRGARSSPRRSGPSRKLGSEFMPPLDEGDLLYMPTTDPSISITKSQEVLQQTDKLHQDVSRR